MSNFYTLELARKTLFASQKAMDVTGHNIANANTEGYSRQVVNFKEVRPTSGNLGDPASNIGGGVVISDIAQVRNPYFDNVYRSENATYNELDTKATAYKYIEDIIGEGSETSIISNLQDVFNAMDELSQNAGDSLLREQLKQSLMTLTNNMHLTANQLYDYQREQNDNVEIMTQEVNQIAKNIRDINERIYQYEVSGTKANDLRDQRNLLVDNLSTYMDIDVSESTNGEYRIDVNGHPLVDHMNNYTIKLENADVENSNSYVSPFWEDTNTEVLIKGGKLKAVIDIRDSMDVDEPGIAYYIGELNKLAKGIIDNFNDIHTEGWTLSDANNPSQPGGYLFDPNKVLAKDIALSDDILSNISNFALSGEKVGEEHPSDHWANNENLLKMLALRDEENLKTIDDDFIGNFETFMQRMTTDIAVTTNYNENRAVNQAEMVDFVTDQRLSTSAVSLDEEAINMMRYQRTYEAAAKLMTVIDEMMQTLMSI